MKSKNIILAILGLLFFCPGIAAYLFYTHPSWLNPSTVNKGHLLATPELIKLQPGKKWSLMLWNPGDCGAVCRQELERLAKIRLALGRRLYLVDEVLLLSDASGTLHKDWVEGLHDNDIIVKTLPASERRAHPALGDTPRIFIGDPQGYLILTYEVKAKPEDIFHDIGLLLNVGKKNV